MAEGGNRRGKNSPAVTINVREIHCNLALCIPGRGANQRRSQVQQNAGAAASANLSAGFLPDMRQRFGRLLNTLHLPACCCGFLERFWRAFGLQIPSELESMKPLEISQTPANVIKAANKRLIQSMFTSVDKCPERELLVSLLHKNKSD